MKTIKLSKLQNLLLNMSGGLQPKDLTPKEIKLLTRTFGKKWMKKLQYEK